FVERLVVAAHGLRARTGVQTIGVFDPDLQLTAGHRREAESQYLTPDVVMRPIRDRELEPARVRDAVDERHRETLLRYEHQTRANRYPELVIGRQPCRPPQLGQVGRRPGSTPIGDATGPGIAPAPAQTDEGGPPGRTPRPPQARQPIHTRHCGPAGKKI